jgi:PAS domain S-box-containing protein
MTKLKIKKAINFIFGEDENYTLENRLFLSAIVVGILTSLIGSIVNLILASSIIAGAVPLFLSIILILIYYLVRFKGIIEPIKIPIIIVSQIGISIIWVFNGGINGSNVMPGFVILMLQLVIVQNKQKGYVLFLFLFLNAIIYSIQLFRPDLITYFPSEFDQWLDSIITLFYTSCFIFLIVNFLHKHYTLERLKSEESEKRYRLSEERLEEAQHIAHTGSWEWDMISNTMNWSKEMYHVFDINPGEFDGKPESLSKLIHPDDVELFTKSLKSKLTNGKSPSLEYRVIHKDGSIHHVLAEGRVQFNKLNQPVRSIGTAQDITLIKLAEDEKRNIDDWLRILSKAIEQSPVTTVITDLSGNIEFVNPKFTETTGYTFNEAIGQNPRILKSGNDPESKYKELWHTILSGNNWYGVFQNKKKNGELYWESAVISPVKDEDGTITHFLAVKEEITERIKAEQEIRFKNNELQKLNAEKDKFFSIIAHDLRGPFGGFLGLTQIMAEELSRFTKDEIQALAVNMKDSATNLYRLLENLLEWSQIQKGSIPFNPTSIHLRTLVDESIAMITDSARNKKIEIVLDIPDDLVVYADMNMIQTVIRNLVSNAVKFTSKTGKVNVSAQTIFEKKIEISVQDTGIGMSKIMIDNLFRIDVQTNRKGTEGEPSTGLGLLLCKEFIEKHGGKIWAESEEGKGSTFHFILKTDI